MKLFFPLILAVSATELQPLLDVEGLRMGSFQYSLGTAMVEERHDDTLTCLITPYGRLSLNLESNYLQVSGLPPNGLIYVPDIGTVNQGRTDEGEVRVKVDTGLQVWILLFKSTADATGARGDVIAKDSIGRVEDLMDIYDMDWVISTNLTGNAIAKVPAKKAVCSPIRITVIGLGVLVIGMLLSIFIIMLAGMLNIH